MSGLYRSLKSMLYVALSGVVRPAWCMPEPGACTFHLIVPWSQYCPRCYTRLPQQGLTEQRTTAPSPASSSEMLQLVQHWPEGAAPAAIPWMSRLAWPCAASVSAAPKLCWQSHVATALLSVKC